MACSQPRPLQCRRPKNEETIFTAQQAVKPMCAPSTRRKNTIKQVPAVSLTSCTRSPLSERLKNALLAGMGKGSIGVEVVKGLLAGGAHVVITHPLPTARLPDITSPSSSQLVAKDLLSPSFRSIKPPSRMLRPWWTTFALTSTWT
jgi:hypothetical protein